MRERATAVAYALGWGLLRVVPEWLGRAVFRGLAEFAWLRRTDKVRQLEANLRRVTGPDVPEERVRALSRAGMRSYLRYFYEMFRLPAMGRAITERTRATGIEELEARIRAGRGVVAALPHMGNWDHAGAWITMRGTPLTTVAQRVRPESVFNRFLAFRTGLGMEVLPLTGGEGNNAGRLARRLREGRLVCLLADRDLTPGGIEVTFFGEPARMPAGPAALAERTGAALMPVSLWYEGPEWRIRVHDEIPVPAGGDRVARVRAMTQELAHVFEGAIAEHPEDWHMLQRVFSADTVDTADTAGAVGSVEEPGGASETDPPRRGADG
ncbi:phosphatidylinositol mannoside acyltransferase [Halostreptopolyspora alba]|uniref:Phosphatidylinositol mannoside acyltransferase n=1 Tax=Halostreptopolyspora alba TaxID=2487137 RepID=A0A3N0E6Z3_9ACTN|nr:phosphatidylinositol mannoside acyltransferase [Nocardiopsaceae bacterium YIM 96095]